MFDNIAMLREDVASTDHLCLFGVGALLRQCYNQIVLSLGRDPDLLIDNDAQKWGHSYYGCRCVSPEELSTLRGTKVVLITVRNFEPIHAQLQQLGINCIYAVCFARGYYNLAAIKPPAYMEQAEVKALSMRGRWVLITGAVRGIGRQIALGLATLGANIIIHSRTIEQSERFAKECRRHQVEAFAVAAELSRSDDLGLMLNQLDREIPIIDVLINNAGMSHANEGEHWKISDKVYAELFAVNTIAPIHLCNHLLPKMIKRGFGRVVNINSSIQYRPSEMAYSCSKAALDKFVHDIAPILDGTGVMISSVDPGWLRTDMGGDSAPHPVESVLPGALLGVLMDRNVNGSWFTAQDYVGLSLEKAMQKALFLHPELK